MTERTGERCPRCGTMMKRHAWTHTPDDETCLRIQLAQAQERERAALARNAQLRELLDRHQWSADGCPECGEFESDGHAEWCEIAAVLADAQEKAALALLDGEKGSGDDE